MFFTLSNKETFLDLLQVKEVKFSRIYNKIEEIPMPVGEEVILVWKEISNDYQFLPIYICTPKGKSREFIAWATTYLKHMRPFTAFVRVVDIEEYIMLERIKNINVSSREINILVGLIIGELLTLQKMGRVKHLNSMAAESTLSYAFAKLFMHNLPFKTTDLITQYETTRNLAGVQTLSSKNIQIQLIWSYLQPIIEGDKSILFSRSDLSYQPIDDILDNLKNGFEISKPMIENVLAHSIGLNYIKDNMEVRVTNFENICSMISEIKISERSASFIIGYLANQISPGTLKHQMLLEPYFKRFPNIFVWYGVFAGLTLQSDVMSFSNGLGWQISKQLDRKINLFEYPESDICFNEYEMLLKTSKPDISFNTQSASNIVVELVPGIKTNVSWPPRKNEVGTNEQEQLQLFNTKDEVYSLDILGKKLYETVEIYEKLLGATNKTDKRPTKPRNKRNEQ